MVHSTVDTTSHEGVKNAEQAYFLIYDQKSVELAPELVLRNNYIVSPFLLKPNLDFVFISGMS